MTRAYDHVLDFIFQIFITAAIEGRRCPSNDEIAKMCHSRGFRSTSQSGGTISSDLARDGRIRIEISGHNYRRVVILTGEHRDKGTQEDPTGAPVWRIIDKNQRIIRRQPGGRPAIRRPQPSMPRAIGMTRDII